MENNLNITNKGRNKGRIVKWFLLGLGIFIVCFVLIDIVASFSLPKTSNQSLLEAMKEYNHPFPPIVGGDSVRIQDDLVFFWPLVFTDGYDKEDGSYHWLFRYPAPTRHPLVLLYWALVSAIISLVALLMMRKFLKRGKK